MTEGYWKLFCVSHSQLALWSNSYDYWLRISGLWVQLESVKHDWRLLKAFVCLPLTIGSVGVMVMTAGCEFKYSSGIFSFLKEKPSLISLILNSNRKNTIGIVCKFYSGAFYQRHWNFVRNSSISLNIFVTSDIRFLYKDLPNYLNHIPRLIEFQTSKIILNKLTWIPQINTGISG